MKNLITKSVFMLTLLATVSVRASAQDTTSQKASECKWSFLAEPYMMFPAMNGAVALSTLPEAELDATTSDIFSNLQIGLMLYLEARTNKWAISSDLIYMDLSQDVKQGNVIIGGEVGAKQLAWELAGLRKVMPWLEIGISGILNMVSSDVNIDVNNVGPGTTNKQADISKSWIEPMIVARVKSAGDKKFIYQFKGEIGGFGIGSDLAWQAELDAGYRFSKLFQVTAGYRIISLDYETGSGKDLFVYDVDTFGPVIRLGFNF